MVPLVRFKSLCPGVISSDDTPSLIPIFRRNFWLQVEVRGRKIKAFMPPNSARVLLVDKWILLGIEHRGFGSIVTQHYQLPNINRVSIVGMISAHKRLEMPVGYVLQPQVATWLLPIIMLTTCLRAHVGCRHHSVGFSTKIFCIGIFSPSYVRCCWYTVWLDWYILEWKDCYMCAKLAFPLEYCGWEI